VGVVHEANATFQAIKSVIHAVEATIDACKTFFNAGQADLYITEVRFHDRHIRLQGFKYFVDEVIRNFSHEIL